MHPTGPEATLEQMSGLFVAAWRLVLKRAGSLQQPFLLPAASDRLVAGRRSLH
jgi:hypothetical protein